MIKEVLIVGAMTLVTVFALNYIATLNPTLHSAIKGF